jgi:hypothetical protein
MLIELSAMVQFPDAHIDWKLANRIKIWG